MKVMVLFLKHIEKYSNLFLKKQKNQYYRAIFDTKCNSIKQLWFNLNRNFSLSKTKTYISIPKLCINNVDITDQKLICNSMNNYFCSAAKIKNSQNELQNYMSKQIPTSMVCETVTRSEIINIVSAFRDNKSPGPDNIGPKILKPILSYVTDPLLYICNLSFTTAIP